VIDDLYWLSNSYPKLGRVQQQLCTRAERGQTPFVGELRKTETDNFYFILFLRVEGDFWCGHTEDIGRRRAYVMRCWSCLQTPKVNVNARLYKEKTRERTLCVHVSNDVLTSVRPSRPVRSARWAPVPISCPTRQIQSAAASLYVHPGSSCFFVYV
jgi:hypothetical protein